MADNTDDLIISISTDQATLRRSIKRIEQDLGTLAGSVKKQFDAVGKAVNDNVATGLQRQIDAMVGVGTKGVKEWNGALADQGKELERLRSKYSPLFATINNYKNAVADIRRAHALGAISTSEYQAAMSKERQAALAATAAIKGRNEAISKTGLSSGAQQANTANIAAQFQDIGVTAAMGMNPLQIALQQGTQLSSVFQTMGSGREIVAGLSSAFMSLVNPVSLVTIGLVAGGAALIQYFSSTDEETAKAAKALEGHAELIRRIRQAWPDATEGLKEYASESKTILRQNIADNIEAYKAQVKAAAVAARDQLGSTSPEDFGGRTYIIQKAQSAIAALNQSISGGNPDLRAFTERLVELQNLPGTPDNIKALAQSIRESAAEGLKAQDALAPLQGTMASIGVAPDQIASIKALTSALSELSKIGKPALTDLEQIDEAFRKAAANAKDREERDDAAAARDAARKRVADNNPVVTGVDGVPVAVPIPGKKPSSLDEAPDKKANSASNAFRDLVKSADDRIAQMRQEIELTGKAGIEADALRFKLELLQQAEEKGRKLSDDQRKQLEKKVDLYKRYADELSKAKLAQDLLEQRKLAGLSATEKKVYQTLHQYGQATDLNSEQANAIRQVIQQQDAAESVKSFLTDFQSALVSSGGDIGEAFASAIKNAINNVLSKVLDDAFSRLASSVASSLVSPKGGTAGAASSVGGAVVSAVGSAPLIPVSRGALPDIGKYAKAIQSIESGGNYSALGPLTKSGDRAYGAYQVMGANIPSWTKQAVGQSLSPSQFLANPAAQDSVFDHYFGKSVSKFGNANDAASVWFTGRPLSQGAAAVDVLGTTGSGYVDKFNSALSKLGSTAETATKGLGSFGSGISQIGSALSGGFPAAPAAGGGGGLLSLFGGMFANPMAISSQARLLAPLAGTGVGLFSGGGPVSGPGSGTSDSIPAMLSDGEFIVKASSSRKYRALLHAINNGSLGHFASGGLVRPVGMPVMPAIARMSGSSDIASKSNVLHVHISGANGDDHVRQLVKQGVDQGLAAQNEQMRRGGFGTMNNRFASQKG